MERYTAAFVDGATEEQVREALTSVDPKAQLLDFFSFIGCGILLLDPTMATQIETLPVIDALTPERTVSAEV